MDVWIIVLIHIGLATTLFFLLNWIGRHSISLGYMQLSVFVKDDEAPAFNFILKSFSPTVFIILVSAFFYANDLDALVEHIWLVVVYYSVFRFLYNAALSRLSLLNWRVQITQWVASIVLAYFAYEKIISTRENLLPDFATVSNELWIVILFYLYSIMNNIKISNEGTRRRKSRYLNNRVIEFRGKYGELIKDNALNSSVERLIYSILLYENFARPKAIRLLENLIPSSIEATRGVMQVRSADRISDLQSVEIAIEKINSDYQAALEPAELEVQGYGLSFPDELKASSIEHIVLRATIANYNKDDDYIIEVQELYRTLKPILEGS